MRRIVFEDEESRDDNSGSELTAAELRDLRSALTERLRSLRADYDRAAAAATTGEAERERLARQIAEARQQIQALATEEAVAKFVEDSERYVLATGTLREELARDPDAEIA